MNITFSGSYSKSTYFEAVRLVYKLPKREMTKRIVLFCLVVIVYTGYVITSFDDTGGSYQAILKIVGRLVTILLLGYTVVQPRLSAYRSASRLWKDPLVRGLVRGRVSENGINFAPTKDWRPWDQFIKVHEQRELLVLITENGAFVALPRGFFKNDTDWRSLVYLVNHRIQEAM